MLRARKYLFAFICARKYLFALCFQVLSNLYVERSAYANVFKFNREKKHFERAKVNSRCFHWFPAAMFILNTIIFSDILCQITRVPNIVHPQNFGMLFIYYSSTIFEFPDLIYWMVSDFIFHLRDNQAYLRDVKTANTCLLKLFCLNWHFACNQRWAEVNCVPKFASSSLLFISIIPCFLPFFGFFRFKTIPV